MSKPRLLTPKEAKGSLVNRLSKTVDRMRQVEVRLGGRPYVVYLVWMQWEAGLLPNERGDGNAKVVCRQPLLPVPKLEDMSLRWNSGSGGRYRQGTIRLTEVSATLTREILTGAVFPERPEDEVPAPYEFFYEVVEDGRHGEQPDRKRFVLAEDPFLDAKKFGWTITLDKQSGDMKPDGTPAGEQPDPTPDPWKTRRLDKPDDDF